MTGYIPPNKPFLVMGGILAAMGGYGVFTTDWYDAYFEGLIPLAVLILGLLGMLGALTTMELDRKELRVKRFGLCLRRIAWEDVRQVGLLYQDSHGYPRKTREHLLVIIPKDCEPFVPQVDDCSRWMERNSRRVIQADPQYVELFEEFYGPMDFMV